MHCSGQSGGECNATCMSITNLITALCSGMRMVNELEHVDVMQLSLPSPSLALALSLSEIGTRRPQTLRYFWVSDRRYWKSAHSLR